MNEITRYQYVKMVRLIGRKIVDELMTKMGFIHHPDYSQEKLIRSPKSKRFEV